jgi:threonine dehydratase
MHCHILKDESDFRRDIKFPTFQDICKARSILAGSIRKTPLHKSDTFSKLTESNIYLKLESLQKTGSFKVRGAFVKMDTLSIEQCKHGVIAASAGNHAQGVAYAASMKHIPCTIIMPENASPAKVAATKAYGANVIMRGSNYDESWKAAEEIAQEQASTIIHAFDDDKIISGQGTIGLEILEDLPELDQIYVPIGGGGLAAGIAIAIKTKKSHVKVIGVESKAYSGMKDSLLKGSLQTVRGEYSIADGISVKSPGRLPYEIAAKYLDDVVLVDDSSIVKTMFLLMERSKLVVEPAGAASLAYLISNKNEIKNKKVVSLLSGGNVDMYLLGQVVAKGLMHMGRMLKIFVQLPDRPGALKTVIDSIAEMSINIVEVIHDRLSSNISAGTAGVFLSLEMENETHANRLINFLKVKQTNFRIVS